MEPAERVRRAKRADRQFAGAVHDLIVAGHGRGDPRYIVRYYTWGAFWAYLDLERRRLHTRRQIEWESTRLLANQWGAHLEPLADYESPEDGTDDLDQEEIERQLSRHPMVRRVAE